MGDRTDQIRSSRAPKLREDQIEILTRYGQTRKTEVGEVLFRAGDTSCDFIVVLEGEVEIVDDFAGEARALFVFISAEANTGWLEEAVELDEYGFILTGRALDRSVLERDIWKGLSREPYLLETSLPGVFAAGDVRGGSIKRVASAVGEGSMAVRLVHQYLADAG
jgi:thioredoxin reductase (NADPH)